MDLPRAAFSWQSSTYLIMIAHYHGKSLLGRVEFQFIVRALKKNIKVHDVMNVVPMIIPY